MNKTIFAISDIHGCIKELEDLLKKVKYNPKQDQLILLGDYIDRGQYSKQVIEYVMELVEEGAIALRGNHDQMLLDFLLKNDFLSDQLYLQNGGLSTLESYLGPDWFEDKPTFEELYQAKKFIMNFYNKHITFLYHLPYYHQIDNHVFIHAGVNPDLDDWKETSKEDMIWIRDEFLYANNLTKDLIFVHGHTPNTILNPTESHKINFSDNNRIGLDGAAAYGGQLNCLQIKPGVYQEYYVKKYSTVTK